MSSRRQSETQEAIEQRRKAQVEAAQEADAQRNNQPHEVVNRTIMQRQAKKVHQQDGK